MHQPYLSIIVPIRNERKRLQYCLPSLLSQSFTDFEIILVEDPGTSDDTASFVKSLHDDRLKYLVHAPGLKVPAKRNFGADHAQGKFLYFIDADMEFPEGTIQALHDEIEKNQAELVFVSERTPGKEWTAKMKDLEKQIIQFDLALVAARLYKRELFLKLGGYKPDLVVGEEVDLSDRAVDAGAKSIVSEAVVYHYEISESLLNHYKKKFKYGMSVGEYFATKQEMGESKTASARASSSRLVYFTSPKTWRNPILGLQFIVFKFLEMAILACGLLYSKFFNKKVITTR